jgi:hypothetical protein
MQNDQRAVTGAKADLAISAISFPQPNKIAPEMKGTLAVGHIEMNRTECCEVCFGAGDR